VPSIVYMKLLLRLRWEPRLSRRFPESSGLASMVTQSILEGTANAFLTLRVGVICQTYCGALTALKSQTVAAQSECCGGRDVGFDREGLRRRYDRGHGIGGAKRSDSPRSNPLPPASETLAPV